MANIGFDTRSHNENGRGGLLKSKQLLSNGTPLAKKQVLGERQNVLQGHKVNSTPFKGNAAQIDGLPGKFIASSSLCNDVLRKQQQKQNLRDAQIKKDQKLKSETYKDPTFDEELFSKFDYNSKCCHNTKSEVEMWAEMDMMDINFGDHRFNFKMDDCEKDSHGKIPQLFNDLDEIPVPPIFDDSMIDFEPFPIMDLPPILDELEELSF